MDEDSVYFKVNFSFVAAVEMPVAATLHILEYFKKLLLEIFIGRLLYFIIGDIDFFV